MRKFFLFLFLLFLCSGGALFFIWKEKEMLASRLLSRSLQGAPTSISELTLSWNGAHAHSLQIQNPPSFQLSTACQVEDLFVQTHWADAIFKNPFIIESLLLRNIDISIAWDPEKRETNWEILLDEPEKKSPSLKKGKQVIVQHLIVENLTVTVQDLEGKVHRYPTLKRIEFEHVSSEEGFPLEAIQRAIFKLVLQELFKKFPIQSIFKALQNIPGSPLKLLPIPFSWREAREPES